MRNAPAARAALSLALHARCAPREGREPSDPERSRLPRADPPPPAHASVELREILAAAPAPDVAAAKARVPDSVGAWKEMLAQADARAGERIGALASGLGVRVDEDRLGGVVVRRLTPRAVAPEHAGHLFVHVHGGAFVKGSGLAGIGEGVFVADRVGIPVVSVDYRMAPDHPAPAAADDVVAVWREVTKGRAARTVALGGTSAGGNLTLVATARIRDAGLPMPAALFAGTPATDLGKRGDAKFLNEGVDRLLASWDAEPAGAMALYLRDTSDRDPLVSPIYADLRGFPPTMLVTGTRDLLLSDTASIHRRLRRAGVEADLHVYEGHSHGDHVNLFDTPESKEHFAELKAFLARHLAR